MLLCMDTRRAIGVAQPGGSLLHLGIGLAAAVVWIHVSRRPALAPRGEVRDWTDQEREQLKREVLTDPCLF